MVTTAPLTEIGSVDTIPGWGAFSTVQSDITEPVAWTGLQRVMTVNRMRVDAQIDSLCSSVTMPILRMNWALNPNGASDEVVEQISTDLGVPILGSTESTKRSRRRFKHRDHLEHALLALWYGHMFFEQVPDTENFDLAKDGWRLRKLAPRMPASIEEIHIARDGGLAGITQVGWRGTMTPKRRSGRGLTLITTPEPQIGVNALAAYVWKREGSNWSGRSMLRPLYRDWVLKDRALRVDSVKNERFGMGIPTATAAPGGDPAQYAKLAENIRASEFGGVGLPNGASVGVEGIRGTLPDIMASIRYYDESMARSFMAMVVQLGQTQTGSRALGETFSDFFQMLVEAVANWYRDTTNEHVIEDLVDWNFGEDEQAPLLEWSYPEGEQMLAITELVEMVSAGVITVDRDTEQAIRRRTRLPQLPDVEEVPDAVNAASSPFSSVGLPAMVNSFIISPEEARELLNMTGPAPTPSQVEKFLASRGMNEAEIKAATAKMLTASRQTVGDSPPFGHRQPTTFELAAGTDFDVLQQNWLGATEDLVADWRSQVQAGQIDELVEQVREAVKNNDLVALTNLEASVSGVDLLNERLLELAEDAIVGAREEALSQGVDIGTLNTKSTVEPLISQRAEATANLLSRGISESASRFASNLGAGLGSEEVAASVREHLEGLTDAYLNDMLGGAMTQAQNTGRKAVMAERPSIIYASELLDGNTCSSCSSIDGKEYTSLEAAELDYPTGGNKNCQGGPRCRGTLVAVYLEGDAAATAPEPRTESEEEQATTLSGMDDHETLASSYAKWLDDNATEEQMEAFIRYTTVNAYQRWNPYLRGMADEVTQADIDQIEALKALINKSDGLVDDVEVFRGVKNADAVFGADPLPAGSTFTDKAFVSTSMDPSIRDYYRGATERTALGSPDVTGAAVTIKIPKGSKVAVAQTEGQVVLPPGSKLRIISDTTEMKIVDQAGYDMLINDGLTGDELQQQLERWKIVQKSRTIEAEVVL